MNVEPAHLQEFMYMRVCACGAGAVYLHTNQYILYVYIISGGVNGCGPMINTTPNDTMGCDPSWVWLAYLWYCIVHAKFVYLFWLGGDW